jgi:ADP-heptose:LPS heptosyltransferase
VATGSERAIQKAVRAVSRAVLARGSGAPISTRSLRRLLLIRSDDRVGNVLLTTPLARALREGLPHVRIDWLVASRRTVVVDGLFLADEIIPYDKRRLTRDPVALGRFLAELRRPAYDAVIDAAHHDTFSLTTALLTRWTQAPIRIGPDRGDAAHFYSHPVVIPEGTTYDVAAKLALLEPLGLPNRGWSLETSLGTDTADQEKAAAILTALGLASGPFVLMNPGARKVDRRFSPQAFGQLASSIAAATDHRSLVLWGPGEHDLARTAVEASRGAAVLAPDTDLQVLAALLRRSALVVTNDTGPMHLGVACEVPVVALFTADVAARWGHPIPAFRAIPAWAGAEDPVAAALTASLDLLKRE